MDCRGNMTGCKVLRKLVAEGNLMLHFLVFSGWATSPVVMRSARREGRLSLVEIPFDVIEGMRTKDDGGE